MHAISWEAELFVLVLSDAVNALFTGSVQHQRLARQEQGSHPGVCRAAHAGVQGTARLLLLQGPGRGSVPSLSSSS